MSISQTAVNKVRAHMAAMRNEEGMEAAQVILILLIVVIGLIPVIVLIRNSIEERGQDVNDGIKDLET